MAKKTKQLSYSNQKEILRTALANALRPQNDEWIYVKDQFPTEAIYEFRNKLYKVTYEINADTYACTLGEPTEVIEKSTYEEVVAPATFSVPVPSASSTQEFVEIPGKIFEAGEWPDKNFSMTDEELDAVVAGFSGSVPIDLEHMDTVLSGQLGEVVSVQKVGSDLHGTVRMPRWLHSVVEPMKTVPVSATFDRVTKALTGLALTLSPRIADAQLVAAFNACREVKPAQSGPTTATTHGGKQKMNLLDRVLAMFKSAPDDQKDGLTEDQIKAAFNAATTPPATPPATPASDDQAGTPVPAEFTAKLAEVEAQNKALAQRALADAGVRFAAKYQDLAKILPSEAANFASLYEQAVLDDNAGVVKFGADNSIIEGPRVKALRQLLDDRPAHVLTTALRINDGGKAEFSDGAKDYLAMTPSGKVALEQLKEAK